jgi:hypothetical protein
VSFVRLFADDQYKWFYWTAPILMLSAVGIIIMLSSGYIRKVLFPKRRGRRVEE